jgi:hypothetical protein
MNNKRGEDALALPWVPISIGANSSIPRYYRTRFRGQDPDGDGECHARAVVEQEVSSGFQSWRLLLLDSDTPTVLRSVGRRSRQSFCLEGRHSARPSKSASSSSRPTMRISPYWVTRSSSPGCPPPERPRRVMPDSPRGRWAPSVWSLNESLSRRSSKRVRTHSSYNAGSTASEPRIVSGRSE